MKAITDGRHQQQQHLPVLIIPGFMSSGLTIQKSPHKSWEGQRLWLNIKSAGFNSLHVGGALRKNEDYRRSTRNLMATAADGEKNNSSAPQAQTAATAAIDPASDEMHQEYIKQMECKSKWLWHMRLTSDMIHEKDGVQVRPIPGTAGVDYLAPGALTESMSWVFGPVLKLLKGRGYKDGVDLDAAPYDWRLPPSELEIRDRYFTNTMKTIEKLYKNSQSKRVVLLCHSMGCKTGHYLLNFVLHKLGKKDGQAWIDRHIHSYVPVGAPHIGAQKSIRATIDGDKMGLEAFLDNNEGLMLGRSLGSAPWLFPIESVAAGSTASSSDDNATTNYLPKPPPIPTVVKRNESALRIILPAQSLNLEAFLHNRKKSLPSKLRLAVKIGEDVIVRTDFIPPTTTGHGRSSSLKLNFSDNSWLIACPPTIERTMKLYPYAQVHLEEPGTGPPPKQKRTIFDCDILWIFRCAWCLFKWIFCCPCALLKKIGCIVVKGARKGADFGAAAFGETRIIGATKKLDWKKGVMASNSKTANDAGEGGVDAYEMWTEIAPLGDVRHGFFLERPEPEKILIKVKWEPNKTSSINSTMVCQKYAARNHKVGDVSYSSCAAGTDLIQMEGLSTSMRLLNETYNANDPIGPLSLSSWQAPPVKNVVAIYGINLPTEVCGVYRRNPAGVRISSAELSLEQLFVLDKEAKLSEKGSKGYIMEDGVISETKDTLQEIVGGSDGGKQKKTSGDGTVPYWSLQHCRAWGGKCNVKVHEIEGAEHRAILNDSRFHTLLLELLGVKAT